jgi:hypothetical protein
MINKLFIIKVYIIKGEMAERFNAAVLKTVDCNRSGGSNPSFSAKKNKKTH